MRVALQRTSRSMGNLQRKIESEPVQKSPNSRDPKVISVSEGLLEESCPLLGDPPHLVRLVRRYHLRSQKPNDSTHRTVALKFAHKKLLHIHQCFNHLELDVASTGVCAPGAEDLQSHVAVTVRDLESADVDDECHLEDMACLWFNEGYEGL